MIKKVLKIFLLVSTFMDAGSIPQFDSLFVLALPFGAFLACYSYFVNFFSCE